LAQVEIVSADLSNETEKTPVRCVVDLTHPGGGRIENVKIELPFPFEYISKRTGLDKLGLQVRLNVH
jgi:hypothetical protein